MDEKDSNNLESIAQSLAKIAEMMPGYVNHIIDLKESEVMLKRIEIMLHDNFYAQSISSMQATKDFLKDFEDGV